ncbi:MAG: PRC-barrel domain-containing protein [Negativicutes bacterium]|nr:PRC-barrel domain-containing protein [Negativicutes bacterium]
MKKSADILGLPVISITEGKELGKVKNLVVNPAAGSVAALAIDDGKWYLGAKLLPFSAIIGLGEYAVTIESSSNVSLYSENPELEKLLTAEVGVIGSKVLTKSGRILGKVNEFIVDLSGKITACEVEDANGEVSHLPSGRVLTFGKEVLIVGETDEPLVAATSAPKVDFTPVTPVPAPAVTASAEPTPVTEPAPAADDSAKKFDDKHRKFLLGKKASRRIETDNGMIIVEQGGEITEEVIQKAKLAGKFVELSMSIS